MGRRLESLLVAKGYRRYKSLHDGDALGEPWGRGEPVEVPDAPPADLVPAEGPAERPKAEGDDGDTIEPDIHEVRRQLADHVSPSGLRGVYEVVVVALEDEKIAQHLGDGVGALSLTKLRLRGLEKRGEAARMQKWAAPTSSPKARTIPSRASIGAPS